MDFSEIVFAIVLGLFAGAVGKLLMPGDDPGGVIATILLGLAGSFVGFLLFTKVLGIGDDEAFDWGGVIGAIVGVMILLGIYRAVAGERRGTHLRT
jgi:uncharacterized membrane protein YeaQ/YmgE (transglycosylase-associated protein family)